MVKQGGQDLKKRTLDYSLRIVSLFSSLPKSTEAQVIGKQLLRSGTSAGAQYREAQRAKSERDFISKIEGALQELEETRYWLELLGEADLADGGVATGLIEETGELIAIFITMAKKVKARG